MQRDSAEKLSFFPGNIDMLQPVLDERFRNLGESRIFRECHRVTPNKIYYLCFSQLLVEKCRSLAFQRFSVNEPLFENAAAVVGNDAINHQERCKRVVQSEFECHED